MIQMLAAWVANLQNIPAPVLTVLIAAFAIEACLYALPGIEGARKRLEQRLRRPALENA